MKTCDSCGCESVSKLCHECLAKRKTRWNALQPSEFAGTVIERLPDKSAFKAVSRWKFGHRGVSCHGPSGAGKSRTVWLLLKREFLAGHSVAVIDCLSGAQFAAMYSRQGGSGDVLDWINRCIEADILLIDDGFKSNMTPGFEGALFAIVTKRTEYGRPIFATMNDSGGSLKSRMSADRADPLLRRLIEFCEPVEFRQK